APAGSVLNLTRNYNGQEDAIIRINKDLTIDGQGHTIDCLKECQAFTSETGTITLKNLNIINGLVDNWDSNADGGALFIQGTAQFTIDNCTFKDNYADDCGGAIYDEGDGDLIIKNSIFQNNGVDDSSGGAVFSSGGDLIIYNSVFENNYAEDYAGAVYYFDQSSLYVEGCSFKSNRVENNVLVSYSHGGAIYAKCKDFYITNSSFNGNYAEDYGGAVYFAHYYEEKGNLYIDVNCSSSSYFIYNSADDNQGGAIYSDSNVFAENTKFSHNYAYVDGGAIYANYDPGFPYDGDTVDVHLKNCSFESNKASDAESQCYGGAIFSNNIVTVDNCTFKDNIAQDYGGAIYAKNVFVNCNDDIGEFSSFFINNRANTNDGGAIYTKDGSVTMVNTVISGNYANVDGGAVYSNHDANLKHCLFDSNTAQGIKSQCYGGAIRAKNDVTVDNSTFKDNYADDYGGAIYAKNVFVNRYDDIDEFSSFFINNKADDNKGGAVYADDGSVTMVNTVLSGNTAEVDGGAIYCGYNINVNHCLFDSNKAEGASSQCYGGAIFAKNDAVINNSTFKDNHADDYAGAVYANNIYVNNNQGSNEAFNSFFIGNKAGDNDGGALYSYCDTRVKNAVFTGNKAYEDGGAIFCCDNTYITHCLFESNIADGAKSPQCEGGAIHCKDDLTVDNCTFNKNYAGDYGGAIYADTLALRGHSYFDSNTAYDNQGGAIWVNKFREDVKYATFTNNKAGEGDNDDGGAIYIDDKNSLTFSQCVFINNHCKDEGGAIYLDSSGSTLSLKNNIFVSNSAGEGQTVYNCGEFALINENWWSKNPSENNDQLIEWKPWPRSNVHHTDSNPLKFTFKLSADSCPVNDSVIATISFVRPNGSPSGEMRTEYFSLSSPHENIVFSNRENYTNYVNIMVSPQKAGNYLIHANLFGESIARILSASDNFILAGLSGQNIGISDNSRSAIANSAFVGNVFDGNLLAGSTFVGNVFDNNQTGDNASVENNQYDSNAPVKSVSQPGNSNNLIYWALALVIIALCAIIVWRKMKN
uniref:right-handed parallel beta-helix repeat-containing protein n=1 Tax=Methanobrevibacter sp. TaxID=66852 RepID=UPI00388F07A1